MKVTKEELIKKINEKVTEEDVAIELIEDVTDSMDNESDTESVDKATYDSLVAEHQALKNKYKERFLSNTREDKNEDEDVEEPKEDEIVDVKEI